MRAVAFSLAMGMGALVATSELSAQREANARFTGVWKLVAEETRDPNGQVVPGPNAASGGRFGFITYDPAGYVGVFTVLVACGLGLPMPEDIALITGGYLAGIGPPRGVGSPSISPRIRRTTVSGGSFCALIRASASSRPKSRVQTCSTQSG